MNFKDLLIEDGIYDNNLRQELWSKKFDGNYDVHFITLLLKLTNIDFTKKNADDLALLFDQDELKLLKEIDINLLTKNKEIIAHWYDTLLMTDKSYLRKYVQLVSINYRDIYNTTEEYRYLIRHLALVKYAKNIFKDDIANIFEQTKNIILNLKYAYWQHEVLKELVSIFPHDQCQKQFAHALNNQINNYILHLDFDSAMWVIKSLGLIKTLSTNECHISLAETYEMQADHYVATKKANTFYPTISQTYHKALKEIKSVPNCDDLRARLEAKIQPELKEDFKMIQAAGVKATPAVDLEALQKNVNNLKIDSFESAYQVLLSLPIPSTERITLEVENDEKSQSFLSKLFSEQVKINSKGAQVASTDNYNALMNNIRGYYREVNITYIQLIKDNLDMHGEITKAFIYSLLEKSQSPFIPEDRLFIYAQGLYQGFNNDFISAAHLLMPQIENSLRHLATQHGITVTALENKIQLENLLGGVLEKIKPLTNPDLFNELKSFLNDSGSVNFRNELAHGLMNTVLLHHYSKYLWWLTLKLVIQSDKYFKAITTSNTN